MAASIRGRGQREKLMVSMTHEQEAEWIQQCWSVNSHRPPSMTSALQQNLRVPPTEGQVWRLEGRGHLSPPPQQMRKERQES